MEIEENVVRLDIIVINSYCRNVFRLRVGGFVLWVFVRLIDLLV